MSSAGTQSASPRHQARHVVEPVGDEAVRAEQHRLVGTVLLRLRAQPGHRLEVGSLEPRGVARDRARCGWRARSSACSSGASRSRSSSCGRQQLGAQLDTREPVARARDRGERRHPRTHRDRAAGSARAGCGATNRVRCRSSASTVPSVTSQESAASIVAGRMSQSSRASSAPSSPEGDGRRAHRIRLCRSACCAIRSEADSRRPTPSAALHGDDTDVFWLDSGDAGTSYLGAGERWHPAQPGARCRARRAGRSSA